MILSVVLISGELSWLALEGLVRQHTSFEWELVIMQRSNRDQTELYKKYLNRLSKASCVKVSIVDTIRFTPENIHKLLKIHISSNTIVVHPHDTFSHNTRLQEATKSNYKVQYTDYQLSYSVSKKNYIQHTDRLNYTVKNNSGGENIVINRKGFVIRKQSPPYLYQDIDEADIPKDIVTRITSIKDFYSEIHFVYPYINTHHKGASHGGPIWRELYYSVRSINKFFKDSPYKIFVVGDHPKIKGVIHIPVDRVDNSRTSDITKKLRKIVNTPQINDNFVYMYDDIIFLRKIVIDDINPIMAHNLVKDIKTHWGTGRKPSDTWIKTFNKTIMKLKYEGLPTYNYETHLPRIFDKNKLETVLNRFKLEEYTYMISTLYYNMYFPKPDLLIAGTNIKADITIPYEEEHFPKVLLGRKFLNYNDMGLNKSLQKFIKTLFLT